MKFGGGGQFGNMMAQAQKMQAEMKAMQEKMAKKEFDFESAGGRIKIKVNGKHEVLELELSKEIIDPEDPGLLADMLKVAINDAIGESQKEISEKMSAIVPPGLQGLM